MSVYYNEWDEYAAQWLRNLIRAGHLPAGEVDQRSIADVRGDDLLGFDQCHFFAGIGGWALAARLAGWPDDRELWTGSCPCQPFSVAGKGEGQADERHLWPEQFRLLSSERPAVWMGEQVAAAVGKDWLDGVCADLESIGYACGATVVPACAVDAPHRRDRLWIVADANKSGLEGRLALPERGEERASRSSGVAGDMAHPNSQRGQVDSDAGGRASGSGEGQIARLGGARDGALADADIFGESEGWEQRGRELGRVGGDTGARAVDVADSAAPGEGRRRVFRPAEGSGPHEQRPSSELARRSNWSDADWLVGYDGKARRVEPGIRLLAHGVSNRVGRLRAYGNAIVPQVAAEVIAAFMSVRP